MPENFRIIQETMDKKGVPILIGIFIFLFIMESVRTLRVRRQDRMRRVIINALVAVPGFIALRLLLLPAMVWVAYKNDQWQIGINYLFDISLWLEGLIAFVLLDYSNYAWHILNHSIPLL